MIQKAKQEGNWDLALKLQAMRNDGRLQSAIVNAVSFGADPSIIYSALQGYNNGGGIQGNVSKPPKEIITTEYEDKFAGLGMPIYAVEAVKTDVQNSK